MEAGRQGIPMGISMDYLLIATILVPGGSILISKVMVPETQQPNDGPSSKCTGTVEIINTLR